jgi:hypothetical protein
MLEFAASGILGSIFGGLFRLAPEVLKFFDRKDDRKHELAMYGLQIDLEKTKGEIRIDEKYVDYSIAQTQAIQTAFEGQAKEAAASYRWVAALSALVRPMVTYVLFGMYVAFKITIIVHAVNSGANWIDIARNHWTPDDFAMLNMILTFWFLGRSIEKRGNS